MRLFKTYIFNKKTSIEQISFSLLFSYLFLYAGVSHNMLLLTLTTVLCVTFSFNNPLISAFSWFNLLPYDYVLRNFNADNLYKLLFLIIMVNTLFYMFRNYYYQRHRWLFYFVVFNISLLVFSSLINHNLNIMDILAYLYLFITLLLLIYLFIEFKDSIELLIYTIGTNSIFLTIFHIVVSTEKRLSSFKNVRVLSNFYGLVSILLLGVLIDIGFIKIRPIKENISKFIFVFFVLVFNIISIMMTHSRGVVVALLLTFFVAIVYKLLIPSTARKDKIKIVFIFIGIILAFYLFSKTPWFELINGDVLIHRLKKKSSENERWKFWSFAISLLSKKQLVFGSGPNMFSDIVAPRYDFYSHSIYIDYLINLGFVGLISLFSFLFYIFVNSFRNKNISSMMLLMFMSVSFFSHGSMYSKYYWSYLAVVYVMSFRNVLFDKEYEYKIGVDLYLINRLITYVKFYLSVALNKVLSIFKRDFVVELRPGIKIFNKTVLRFENYVIGELLDFDPNELKFGFDALNNKSTYLDTSIGESHHLDLMQRYHQDKNISNSTYILKSNFGILDERSYQYYTKKRLKEMKNKFESRKNEIIQKIPYIYVYQYKGEIYIIDGKHRAALAVLLEKPINAYLVDNEYIVESFRYKMYEKTKGNQAKYSKNIEFFEGLLREKNEKEKNIIN